MKTIIAILFVVASSASAATNLPTVQTGVPKTEEKGSYLADVSVSPYGTVAFDRFDGKARTSAGVELGLGGSRTVSFVAFGKPF